jgi:hypothetical protein
MEPEVDKERGTRYLYLNTGAEVQKTRFGLVLSPPCMLKGMTVYQLRTQVEHCSGYIP